MLVTIALAIAAAEIGLRRLAPQEPPGMYMPDPALGFRLTPGYRGVQLFHGQALPLEFNSWGMRDRELGPPCAGVQRVLVLGDSFMFGHSVRVEQSFPKLLEQLLRARLGEQAVEVVNGGIPRYGTSQEWMWFEQTAELVRPDVVVLGMFVSNDIADNMHFGRVAGEGAPQWRSQGLMNWLRVRSQLLIWLRHRRSTGSERPALLEGRAFATHAKTPPADIQQGIALTESYLRKLNAAVRQRGATLAVVLIPDAVQVYPERWDKTLARLHAVAADYEREEPSRHFSEVAGAEGIPVFDLLPVLERQRTEELYLKLHWNARGHAVAAAAAAAFLLDNHVIGAAQ